MTTPNGTTQESAKLPGAMGYMSSRLVIIPKKNRKHFLQQDTPLNTCQVSLNSKLPRVSIKHR